MRLKNSLRDCLRSAKRLVLRAADRLRALTGPCLRGPTRPRITDIRCLPAFPRDAELRRVQISRRWSVRERQEITAFVGALHRDGASDGMIARHLNAQGLRTQLRCQWNAKNVRYYRTVPDRRSA